MGVRIVRSTIQTSLRNIPRNRIHRRRASSCGFTNAARPGAFVACASPGGHTIQCFSCLLTVEGVSSLSLTEGRRRSMSKPTDLVQGTLDLLILKTLLLEPAHGWAIAQRIRQISE